MRNEIRRLREEAGLSQGALGTELGVSRQTVNSLETGRYDPSLPLAFAIARYFGATIEEMSQNREGARLVGINTNRVGMLTFAISGALAAIGAALIAPTLLLSPSMGEIMNLKVFAIIILGGMGSVPGAIVGAFLLAFAEVFGGFYIDSNFADVIGFAALVVVLAIRPQGLFQRGA